MPWFFYCLDLFDKTAIVVNPVFAREKCCMRFVVQDVFCYLSFVRCWKVGEISKDEDIRHPLLRRGLHARRQGGGGGFLYEKV